ncbi:hypothetical protein EXU30_00040 [Shewanella maritima]|uniref:Uncharacterized protein n=1 Tax=Shewanella maritima TaxID=2520507 RepID=A0A411PCJ1_9GAMM|nr:hypothetical protein [Shewanella maritima]QBF81259.1 hypothetical protein EXU30_00040 [Shewanella maritima]
MKKPNPTVVGKMRCECGEVMEVRQRSNGRKLLYTYCPACKVDQRSSQHVQDYWRDNMVAPDTPDDVIAKLAISAPEPTQETKPDQVPAVIDDDELEEWSPAEMEQTEIEPEQGSGLLLPVGLFFGAIVALIGFNAAFR